MKFKKKLCIKDFLWYALGCGIYAAAVRLFVTANEITPGGFTGFAALVEETLSIPLGLTVLLLNLPVLWLGFRHYGMGFIAKTAVATLLLSGTLTLAEILLPQVRVNHGLAAVFGGLLMGFALGTVMLHGATTGGVDIIAKLLNGRYPHITVGRLILYTDAVIVALAAVVYGNIESALYSIVALYVSGRVTDLILYGADRGKIVLAVTKHPDEICNAVHTKLRRGVTKAQVTGSYSGRDYTLLICTVRRYEIAEVHRIISACDPNAFMVIGDVSEVLGEGFKSVL